MPVYRHQVDEYFLVACGIRSAAAWARIQILMMLRQSGPFCYNDACNHSWSRFLHFSTSGAVEICMSGIKRRTLLPTNMEILQLH